MKKPKNQDGLIRLSCRAKISYPQLSPESEKYLRELGREDLNTTENLRHKLMDAKLGKKQAEINANILKNRIALLREEEAKVHEYDIYIGS